MDCPAAGIPCANIKLRQNIKKARLRIAEPGFFGNGAPVSEPDADGCSGGVVLDGVTEQA